MTAKFTFINRSETRKSFDLVRSIDEFINARKLEKRSPKTIIAYEHTLNQFLKWFQSGGAERVTSEVMRNYIQYLTFEKEKWDDHPTNKTGSKGLSPRSINNIIRNLRVFFNFLVKERIVSESPMNAINYQRENKDTFEVFTDSDVLRLMASPNQRTYTGYRDFVMMLFLADTGVRVKEMTNLKISDIDFKLKQVVIRAEISKTNTTRVVPLSDKTIKELEKLINFMNVEKDDYLWLTQFGERYFADTFSKMLKRYAKTAKVTGVRVSPHTFRHYFAVKFLRSGGDPLALMRILGHTSLKMTETYVKYSISDLSEQHEKASPVMNLLDSGNNRKRGKVKFS